MTFTAEVDDAEVNIQVQAMMARVSDASLTQFLQGPASQFLSQRAAERFFAGGDDATGPWRPLKRSTRAIKRDMGLDRGINIRTGGLLRWLTRDPSPFLASGAGGMWMMWPGNATEELEEKLETAQEGNIGVLRGRHFFTMPRPVVALSGTDAAALAAGLKEWVEV